MGAYLSEPITEKISSDEANEFITCGASSMQGWRMSQEDAHNCVLDFDKNTSLFAVYDGHGGAEVALYCAQKLPEFLKDTEEYKSGNYEQALKDAFIGFDATLTQDKVHAELKSLIPADKRDRESETEEDIEDGDDDIEELAELCQESRMPLNELLEKYKDGKKNMLLNKIKKDEESAAKPISPYLRGRRNKSDESDGGGSSGLSSKPCSSEAVSSNIKRKLNDELEDEQVSSSSASSSKAIEKAATGLSSSSGNGSEASGSSNGPTSSNEDKAHNSAEKSNYISPDSSSTKNKKTAAVTAESSSSSSSEAVRSEAKSIANGEVSGCDKSQENEISTNSSKCEGVSSSSSAGGSGSSHAAVENGEVSSNSTSGAEFGRSIFGSRS